MKTQASLDLLFKVGQKENKTLYLYSIKDEQISYSLTTKTAFLLKLCMFEL